MTCTWTWLSASCARSICRARGLRGWLRRRGRDGAARHRGGVGGGNLEDQLKPIDEAIAAVEAVLRAGREAGIDFVLNARTDAFCEAAPDADRDATLQEAINRGKAFLEVGAPVVFVPGVVACEDISALVDALGPRKLTVISMPGVSLPASAATARRRACVHWTVCRRVA